jgi:hypothetical protein
MPQRASSATLAFSEATGESVRGSVRFSDPLPGEDRKQHHAKHENDPCNRNYNWPNTAHHGRSILVFCAWLGLIHIKGH